MAASISNRAIADVLDQIAEYLESQRANPFRVRAYREGADTIRQQEQAVADWIESGQLEKLKALPNIGEGITAVVGELVTLGASSLLKELKSQAVPEQVFIQVPGIGMELAERIVDDLHIQTLPELEEAAHDGRLQMVDGFGRRRVEGVRTALAGMLSQSEHARRNRVTTSTQDKKSDSESPSVALLLEIDGEYRQQAETGKLQKIAPRRFNPNHEAWLPLWHTQRDGWKFTTLFSNTAQAHKLDKTHDWVVIYFERDGQERQQTVVTETKGPIKGKRVIRGREMETRQYYAKQDQTA